MKSLLVVVLLAAAATAAVVSNDKPDIWEVLDAADGDEVDNGDVNELPTVDVTDLTELIDEADLPEEIAVANRRNLSQGIIGASDRLVFNNVVSAQAVANHVHVRDIRVNANSRITAIRVTRVGASQNATPSILNGGIGNTAVTIRIRSARGRGYNYRIQVYAR